MFVFGNLGRALSTATYLILLQAWATPSKILQVSENRPASGLARANLAQDSKWRSKQTRMLHGQTPSEESGWNLRSLLSSSHCGQVYGHTFYSRTENLESWLQENNHTKNSSHATPVRYCQQKCERSHRCHCSIFSADHGGSCSFYRKLIKKHNKLKPRNRVVPSSGCPLVREPSPWNKQCIPEQTKNFSKFTSKSGFDGVALARDLARAIGKRRLAFIGDSVTGQHFTEVVCAIVESTTVSFAVESRDCRGLWGSGMCVRFFGDLDGTEICYTRIQKNVYLDPTVDTIQEVCW